MSFFNNLLRSKVVQVVSIQLKEDGNSYHFVKCNYRKGEFFAETIETFESKESLDRVLKVKYPLILHFFGKGILNRRIENSPDYIDKLIVNGKKDDFYFATLDFEDYKYVSFTRKDHVSSEVEFFQDKGGIIIDISIGPFVSQSHALPVRLSVTPTTQFEWKSSRLFDFKIKNEQTTDTSYEFRGWHWGNRLYAGILAYLFLENETFPSVLDEKTKSKSKTDLADKKQFEGLGLFTLAFFLIALTGNYLYQGKLSNDNAKLEDDITVFSDNLNRIDYLSTEIDRKSQLVRTSGILNYRFISFYLDQLGETISKDIRLTELTVFPLKKQLKQKKRPEFAQSNILISGLSISSTSLENWLKKVDRLEWMGKSEILNFSKKSDKVGVFTVKLFIK